VYDGFRSFASASKRSTVDAGILNSSRSFASK
jgi:hypothetical protein